MIKPRTAIVLSACVGAVGVLLAVFVHRSQPRYHSRSLQYWVEALVAPGAKESQSMEAATAINSIGTNALPFLLEWIQYEPPPWKTKLNAYIARLRRSPPEWPAHRDGRQQLAIAADRAIWLLGPRALPALPELARLMNDTSKPESASRAAGALRTFGTNSLPVLLAVVDSPGHPCRTTVICVLEAMGRDVGPGMAPAIPHLIQCLDPTNGSSVPGWAARALGEFRFAPQQAVPALAECLTRHDKYLQLTCAQALGSFGESAVSALPALTNALADRDPQISKSASNAIVAITTPAPTNAPAR